MSSSTLSLPPSSRPFDLFFFLVMFLLPLPTSLEFPAFSDSFAHIPFLPLVKRFASLRHSCSPVAIGPLLQFFSWETQSVRSSTKTLSPFFHGLGTPRLPSRCTGGPASRVVVSPRTVPPFEPCRTLAEPALRSSVLGIGDLPSSLWGITLSNSRARPRRGGGGTRDLREVMGGEEDEGKRRWRRW